MKLSYKPLLGLVLFALTVFSSSSAFAGFATAEAMFTDITISRSSVDISWDIDEDELTSLSFASDGLADPGNNGTTFHSTLGLLSEGTATSAPLGSALGSGYAFATAEDVSVASAINILDFTLFASNTGSAPGTIVIELDYELYVETGDNPNNNAFAFVSLEESFVEKTTSIDVTEAFFFDIVVGTLTVVIDVFGEDEEFSLSAIAEAGAASAVPVPAAVWLFGSALAGLVGLRGRKVTK